MKTTLLGILFIVWLAVGIYFFYKLINPDVCDYQPPYRTECMDEILDNCLKVKSI